MLATKFIVVPCRIGNNCRFDAQQLPVDYLAIAGCLPAEK